MATSRAFPKPSVFASARRTSETGSSCSANASPNSGSSANASTRTRTRGHGNGNAEMAGAESLSFEDVYETYFNPIWRYLSRCGIAHRHLEDIAHDVFVVVLRRLPDFDPNRPIKPWLYGIAFRVASEHIRRKGNHEALDATLDPPDTRSNIDETLCEQETRALVWRALAKLDPERRQVFVLHEIEEIAAPAIAEIVGIPLNTVYSRLRVARQRFAQTIRALEAKGHRP